jgi:uncharacterized damage-inducible protein DinB
MLLDHLSDEQLAFAPSARARSIGDQFAHLHDVRLMWMDAKLAKLEKAATKAELRTALETSAVAMAERIAVGKVKGAKRGMAAFCGYLLAHEAHHRGQIVLHLKNAGMRVDPKVAFAIWEWQQI